MTRWEYKRVEHEGIFANTMDELGYEGWEAYAVTSGYVYFKRPL